MSSSDFSKEELAQILKEEFEMYDADGSGFIEKKEIKKMLKDHYKDISKCTGKRMFFIYFIYISSIYHRIYFIKYTK